MSTISGYPPVTQRKTEKKNCFPMRNHSWPRPNVVLHMGFSVDDLGLNLGSSWIHGSIKPYRRVKMFFSQINGKIIWLSLNLIYSRLKWFYILPMFTPIISPFFHHCSSNGMTVCSLPPIFHQFRLPWKTPLGWCWVSGGLMEPQWFQKTSGKIIE